MKRTWAPDQTHVNFTNITEIDRNKMIESDGRKRIWVVYKDKFLQPWFGYIYQFREIMQQWWLCVESDCDKMIESDGRKRIWAVYKDKNKIFAAMIWLYISVSWDHAAVVTMCWIWLWQNDRIWWLKKNGCGGIRIAAMIWMFWDHAAVDHWS